jgi:uncharacterized RmlC-like cupin family protein
MAEGDRFGRGSRAKHYERMLEKARHEWEVEQSLRGRQVVKAEEMPWESSEHGLMKHVLNEFMDYPKVPVDSYLLLLPPGASSGKHQHAYEECAYIIEGKGYDHHWDPIVEMDLTYQWSLAEEPTRWDWEGGDFVYIPPLVAHQHINSDPVFPVRLLISHNRLYSAMGYGHVKQLESASAIDPDWETKLGGKR